MNSFGTVVEVAKLINKVSSELTTLMGEPVVLQLMKPQIQGMTYDEHTQISVEKSKLIQAITTIVCQHYMTNIVELRGPDRTQPLPDARKVASLLMKHYVFDISSTEIGEAINRDRSSAIHNVKDGEAMLRHDKKFKFDYNRSLLKLRETIHNDKA